VRINQTRRYLCNSADVRPKSAHDGYNPPPESREIGSGAEGAAEDCRGDGNVVSDVSRPDAAMPVRAVTRHAEIWPSPTLHKPVVRQRFLGSCNLAGGTVFFGRERRRWWAADINVTANEVLKS